MSNELELLEFKLEKIMEIKKHAEKFRKYSFFNVLWPLLDFFSVSNGVSLCKTGYKLPIITYQLRYFPRTCHINFNFYFTKLPFAFKLDHR